jgi:hypothetical protein
MILFLQADRFMAHSLIKRFQSSRLAAAFTSSILNDDIILFEAAH